MTFLISSVEVIARSRSSEIFKWLVDHVPYRPERVAWAFELLASTFLDEHHDLQKTLQYWKAACDVRDKFGIVKPILPAKPQYRHMKEFTSKPELEPLALDLESCLRCQRQIWNCQAHFACQAS